MLYEKLYDYKNNLITTGKILYSKVLLKNDSIEMYLFKSNEKEADFYDSEGKSIRKTLMKTPIDGARLSSGFGKRRHPILGYNKMHRGIDFAAKEVLLYMLLETVLLKEQTFMVHMVDILELDITHNIKLLMRIFQNLLEVLKEILKLSKGR